MTIRENVSTREATRAPALVSMPAFRALPALADPRTHPVLRSLSEKSAASATGTAAAMRHLHGRVRAGLDSCLDALPTMQMIRRAARRESLIFLRDNGFEPLASLFALSPRLAWAITLPFGMTSLFGIFIFGIELVLVSALGLFFAFLVANDAARRLQEGTTTRKGATRSTPLVLTIPDALPAPAETPLTPLCVDKAVAASQPVSANRGET